jgi:hypothetical protein
MDSGFAAEDEYSTYSKPLFDRSEASTVYRPKKDDSEMYGDVDAQMSKLSDTSRFKADKGFKGADSAGDIITYFYIINIIIDACVGGISIIERNFKTCFNAFQYYFR